MDGRVIIFDIGYMTLGNLYLPSGTDAASRSNRENYFSEIIPQLLVDRQDMGIVGGDMNCIMRRLTALTTQIPSTRPVLPGLSILSVWLTVIDL